MIQWIIFALIAFFGLGYAVRQELRMRAQDAEDGEGGAPERARTAKKTDAEIEDEILDAAR